MLNRVTGVLFIALGVLSMVDGWRVTEQARPTGNFDAIGPDRYLMGLGALMLIAGLWRLLARLEAEPQARAVHILEVADPRSGAGPFRRSFGSPIGFSPACFCSSLPPCSG
jgi:hypothetical protein